MHSDSAEEQDDSARVQDLCSAVKNRYAEVVARRAEGQDSSAKVKKDYAEV